jgi:uncharacterized protein YhfF
MTTGCHGDGAACAWTVIKVSYLPAILMLAQLALHHGEGMQIARYQRNAFFNNSIFLEP